MGQREIEIQIISSFGKHPSEYLQGRFASFGLKNAVPFTFSVSLALTSCYREIRSNVWEELSHFIVRDYTIYRKSPQTARQILVPGGRMEGFEESRRNGISLRPFHLTIGPPAGIMRHFQDLP